MKEEVKEEEVNEEAKEEINEVSEIKQEEPNEQLIHVLSEQTLPVDECDDSLMNEEDSIIPPVPSSEALTEQTEQNNDSVVFVSENPLESTEDVEKTC